MADNFVPPPEDHPQTFLNKLVEFLGEEDFEDSLTGFLRENASKVEFTTRGEEQKLETYTIYQKYLALVENKLEGFASKQGCTPVQFQEMCLAAKQADSSAHMFLDALIASWDFDTFMQLVQDFLLEEAEVSQKPDSVDNDEDDDGPNNPDEDIEI